MNVIIVFCFHFRVHHINSLLGALQKWKCDFWYDAQCKTLYSLCSDTINNDFASVIQNILGFLIGND